MFLRRRSRCESAADYRTVTVFCTNVSLLVAKLVKGWWWWWWWRGGGGVVVVGSPGISPQTEVLGVSHAAHAGVRNFLGAQSFGYISAAVACGDTCLKRARNHRFCTTVALKPKIHRVSPNLSGGRPTWPKGQLFSMLDQVSLALTDV